MAFELLSEIISELEQEYRDDDRNLSDAIAGDKRDEVECWLIAKQQTRRDLLLAYQVHLLSGLQDRLCEIRHGLRN